MIRGRGSSRQVVYTLAELASMAGVSKYRTQNLLRSNGVKMHWSGNKRVVLLSSIEESFPQLTDALRFRNED